MERRSLEMGLPVYKRAINIYQHGGVLLFLRKLLWSILLRLCVFMSPVVFAKLEMFFILGYWPNIDNPKTLNEKINYRKLFAPHPLSVLVSDKYAARAYVVSKTGRRDLLNDIYFVGGEPGKIPFDDLPNKFVIKANHGSGWNIIVFDKSNMNRDKVVAKCNMWLSRKYSDTVFSETHYDKIIPKIIVEKFIEDSFFYLPLDYKFLCFDGKVHYIETVVRSSDNYREIHYDTNWNKINFRWGTLRAKDFTKPRLLDEMIIVAEKIAGGFDFCRVDLYCPDNKKIIFGEITLTPGSGLSPFYPRKWDYRLGKLWKMQINPTKRGSSYQYK